MINSKIPVSFHNGKGYDTHFIIQELSNIEQIEQINIIPKNEENILHMDLIIWNLLIVYPSWIQMTV